VSDRERPARCVIVVPCYQEERRLQPSRLLKLLDAESVSLLLVDDGSRDATPMMLRSLAEVDDRVAVLRLPHNRGKAEAVRVGLQAALEDGAAVVAYCDADLSTPPEEMLRLVGLLRNRPDLSVVLGARVSLLGRDIRRSLTRHYLGRIFASCASIVLRLRVYDTQCGAKVLRDTPALRRALAHPFGSRWAFDVELIGRLLAGARSVPPIAPGELLEVPLLRWEDPGGSKLSVIGMACSALSLLRIRSRVRKAMSAPVPASISLSTRAVPPIASIDLREEPAPERAVADPAP
jgi:dolichyl-phosphate beta-glucosyltransferase